MGVTIQYGTFARVRPANTNEQDLYACGPGEEIVGKINICNQDGVARTFKLALTDTGAGVAASGEDWIAYDMPIDANLPYRRTIAISATGTIRIQASVADKISFSLMGMKKTTT